MNYKQRCAVCVTPLGTLNISHKWIDKHYKGNKLKLKINVIVDSVFGYCDITQNIGTQLFSYEMGLVFTDITLVTWRAIAVTQDEYTLVNEDRGVRVIPIHATASQGMSYSKEGAWELFVQRMSDEKAFHKFMYDLRKTTLNTIKDGFRPDTSETQPPSYMKAYEKYNHKLKEYSRVVLS